MTPEEALAAENRAYNTHSISNETTSRPSPTPITSESLVTLPTPTVVLTKREIEVLRLIAQGLTNNQIAHQLHISPHTVNTHVQAIYSRLGVTSRSAATRYAVEKHLV